MNVGTVRALLRSQGYKFETFVFDARARDAQRDAEVERQREFSPVKNAAGEDSPATTRADLCRLHSHWVRTAGFELPAADDYCIHPVESSNRSWRKISRRSARRPARPLVNERGHLYR